MEKISTKEIFKELSIICYQYDTKREVFICKYPNSQSIPELVKLTNYLTAKKITFEVFENQNIKIYD